MVIFNLQECNGQSTAAVRQQHQIGWPGVEDNLLESSVGGLLLSKTSGFCFETCFEATHLRISQGRKRRNLGKPFLHFRCSLAVCRSSFHPPGCLQNFSSTSNFGSRGCELLQREETFCSLSIWKKPNIFCTAKRALQNGILFYLISCIMARLQKLLLNHRTSRWAWLGEEPGVRATLLMPLHLADCQHLSGSAPPWLAGSTGCISAHTNTRPRIHVRFRLVLH